MCFTSFSSDLHLKTAKDFLNQLLQHKYIDRPTSDEIVKHSFLTNSCPSSEILQLAIKTKQIVDEYEPE